MCVSYLVTCIKMDDFNLKLNVLASLTMQRTNGT